MLTRFTQEKRFEKFCDILAGSAAGRVIDAVIIGASLQLSCVLYGVQWTRLQTVALAVSVVGYSLVAELSGAYRSYRDESLSSRIGRIWAIWSIAVALLLLTAFVTKTSESYSRASSMIWFISVPILLAVWHGAFGTFLRLVRAKGHNVQKAAFVGLTPMSAHLACTIKSKPWMGLEIVGYFEDRSPERCPDADEELGPYLGNYEDLVLKAEKGEVDTVYISLPMRAEIRINSLVRRLGTTTASIYLAHNFGGFNLMPPNCASRWSQIGNVSVLGVVESPFQGILGVVKQIEDMIFGTVFLAITAVPMAVIAVAVKATSSGPIFFRQTRYGLNGKKIDVLKFRTMTVCENGAEVRQAKKNDNRVTRIGAFLRRTSLDELPQFFHVITGKMSIVGPRPHAVAHNEQYRGLIDHYMVRHKVKPGITGWAQVNGWRGETDTDEKMQKRVEYDLRYIRDWSPLLDMKIIFLTVFGRKTHRNAY